MASSPDALDTRIARLKADIVAQAGRVLSLVEQGFDAVYASDAEAAKRVIALDDTIDRTDVEIEKAAVALLDDATKQAASLGLAGLREVLTIVKINNELERAADAGVRCAEHVATLVTVGAQPPATFRVMTNSLLGILRDVGLAYDTRDGSLAKVVLESEDTVESFKVAILKDLEARLARGEIGVDAALVLHEIANDAFRIADYCSNIAEQVLYATTGKIVRHTEAGWIELPQQSG